MEDDARREIKDDDVYSRDMFSSYMYINLCYTVYSVPDLVLSK